MIVYTAIYCLVTSLVHNLEKSNHGYHKATTAFQRKQVRMTLGRRNDAVTVVPLLPNLLYNAEY